MMWDLLWILPAMALLMAMKAFFSGSEIALVSADHIHLRHRASRGDRGAAAVLKMEQKPELYLATTLVGTNLSIVSLTTLGTLVMMRIFGESGEIYAILLLSPLFLVFTEVVPKSVFQHKADDIAPRVIWPLRGFMVLLFPVVFLFATIARLAARLVGSRQIQHVFMTREMVKAVLDTAERAADVSDSTWTRLKHAVRLSEVSVGEVMIPMAEVTALGRSESTRRAIELACTRGHFRIPIFEDETSAVVGIVALDMWKLMDPELPGQPLESLIQPAEFVVAQQPVYELLNLLSLRNDRMAIVVDEFGSAIGMITLEDIHEAVVGDVVGVGYNIPGYVHRPKQVIEQLSDDEFLVDGQIGVAEINEQLGISLPLAEGHTIGGLVTARLRHLPARDEAVVINGFRFTVTESSGRLVRKLRVEAL
ncbi:MAG: hemolysin family protein [Pseudomonadales bacterium]